jgi:hypothetical protein
MNRKSTLLLDAVSASQQFDHKGVLVKLLVQSGALVHSEESWQPR